ncbi:hypothetical protein M8998_05665 [Sphingobacterium sp. lm-10]|uniref:hypothetical protein n=1 Tax=Sphingobacterium sp. lm-10 TaxID=2944904 RepID=UPI0020213BB6|nr:hypothetical protein [Sphingobacterium sp. lm-10]MCL7987423.1 hypothetical protein [Sphingobacterium sp. lm-10]
MTVNKEPLSIAEKAALKKLYSMRMIVGATLIFPLLLGCLIIAINSLWSYVAGNQDAGDFFGVVIVIVCAYLFFKFGLPFYKQTLSNIRATHKIVIDTYIVDLQIAFTPGVGHSYVVFTEADRPVRSTRTSLVNPEYEYKDMKVGDKIRIHCMENNQTDILHIEPR